ncbi:MAG: glycosyltransferase [Verrucomicrobiota bacterium]
MNVLFAPDYRPGNPYQANLATALESTGGCTVSFPSGYRRGLPLARMLRDVRPDLLHLHWPEAYCDHRGPAGFARQWRLALDLALAGRTAPYVMTAHNLWPHHLPRTAGLRFSLGRAYRGARAVIAHSAEAARLVGEQWGVPSEAIRVIPHGNLVEHLPTPVDRPGEAPFALNFGVIAPYKGLEELIACWRRHRPGLPLRIVGIVNDPDYPPRLARLVDGDEIIQLRPGKLADEDLAATVSAAKVVIINHSAGLTSGVASLARSLATNILLPARLAAVDLMEPHPSVFRFESLQTDFPRKLAAALQTPRQPIDPHWWRATSWENIAGITLDLYRTAVGG